MDNNMIAACGLDCRTCDIRLAPTDPASANVVINWFRKEGWLSEDEGMKQIIERKMYCTGCFGVRDIHWSSECWILLCCVDQRALDNCSQCEMFACDRLVGWSKQNENYTGALVRLKGLRAALK